MGLQHGFRYSVVACTMLYDFYSLFQRYKVAKADVIRL